MDFQDNFENDIPELSMLVKIVDLGNRRPLMRRPLRPFQSHAFFRHSPIVVFSTFRFTALNAGMLEAAAVNDTVAKFHLLYNNSKNSERQLRQ